jgi:hypothetical protein
MIAEVGDKEMNNDIGVVISIVSLAFAIPIGIASKVVAYGTPAIDVDRSLRPRRFGVTGRGLSLKPSGAPRPMSQMVHAPEGIRLHEASHTI